MEIVIMLIIFVSFLGVSLNLKNKFNTSLDCAYMQVLLLNAVFTTISPPKM